MSRSTLDKLERRLSPYSLPNLTLYIMLGQIVVYGLALTQRLDPTALALIPARVAQGEIWRLGTFLLVPPDAHPVFMAFAWYLFYLMGSTLENIWGQTRYNLYLLIAAAATFAAALATPNHPTTASFIATSIFLAFARLNPDFQLALFFILPVRIYWLALLNWVFIAYAVLFLPPPYKLAALAAIVNFLIFFGKDLLADMRSSHRRMKKDSVPRSFSEAPFHTCARCGTNDQKEPHLNFRYRNDEEFCERCLKESDTPSRTTPEAP